MRLRRRVPLLGLTVPMALLAFASTAAARPPVRPPSATSRTPDYVVVGDDPDATGDQWGLHESYYSELRTAITTRGDFGPAGTVEATFTIGEPRSVPLSEGSLDDVDVYLLSARQLDDDEIDVLDRFVRDGGALVVNSNAPGFFDTTAWLGFELSDRVVFGDGPAHYDTTHRAPSPSVVLRSATSHPVVHGPFGHVAAFDNWHTVAGFVELPPTATALARTTLTGPDDNGSDHDITIEHVVTLAVIDAGRYAEGAGPIVVTSDVDTFSNAYTTNLGFPRTDRAGTLAGTANGRLARNTFAWIAEQLDDRRPTTLEVAAPMPKRVQLIAHVSNVSQVSHSH